MGRAASMDSASAPAAAARAPTASSGSATSMPPRRESSSTTYTSRLSTCSTRVSEIVVTVELPGARENEIKVEQRDALLAIESQGERRYAKEVLLPGAIDGNSLQKKYNNGVLEIRARKV